MNNSKYKSSELLFLKYALERIASRLVSDGEFGTGGGLVLTTDGVTDLLVFGLLDGGLVGLRPWKSMQSLVLGLGDAHLISPAHLLLDKVDG